MAAENVKNFIEEVQNNPKILKTDKELDETAVLEAAKRLGYEFTAEELKEAMMGAEELNAEELENVTGGIGCARFGSNYPMAPAKRSCTFAQ